jgi:hypothetical protein
LALSIRPLFQGGTETGEELIVGFLTDMIEKFDGFEGAAASGRQRAKSSGKDGRA